MKATETTAAGYDQDQAFMLVEIAADEMHFQTISRVGATVDSQHLAFLTCGAVMGIVLPSMLIHELTPTECAEILERTQLGRLACSKDGQPYVVPIHFSFDRERRCLYSFSAVGQKVVWMRENPKVCLEVEDITDRDHWRTVVVYGLYEEIHDSPAEAEARRRAQERFERRPEWWLPAAAKVGSRQPHAVVVYRIRIDRVTGRKSARTK